MHLQSFVVRNFRRLRRVKVDLAQQTTVFVGANNSGKTSAMHVFQQFIQSQRFSVHDFSAECWDAFNAFDPAMEDSRLPDITLDLWFDPDEQNVHRVLDLLPDLDWDQDTLVGVRLAYEPKDPLALHGAYVEARGAATATDDPVLDGELGPEAEAGQPVVGNASPEEVTYRHGPRNLYDYLRATLDTHYHVVYYKLDRRRFDKNLDPLPDHRLQRLEGGKGIVASVLRVDLLNAQRHLSDSESRGRDEDLSKTLSRFYRGHLKQREPDPAALKALSDSEQQLNRHFAEVFQPTLERLNQLGYPGLTNPELMIKAELSGETLLSSSAQVHYGVPGVSADPADGSVITLPDRYNGLGFKNLIYMVVEILAAYRSWQDTEVDRPPVHLIMLEEPESHLHAQLQQVFIRQLRRIVEDSGDDPETQFILTTHSAHIVYEDFRSIRYFARVGETDAYQYTEVKDLSVFYQETEEATRRFLLQYLKLTHCDLFFADAVILVEGNVERLLLPLMIAKRCPSLTSSHLTILEVGGAFAHKFRELVDFLDIHCLVITDLDSVEGPSTNTKACRADKAEAVTSNQTLRQWLPQRETVDELLTVDLADKTAIDSSGVAKVKVAYQTREKIHWDGQDREIAGRTFEEAFAFENLDWTQDGDGTALELSATTEERKQGIDGVLDSVFERVRSLDKTEFALTLISLPETWECPAYITEGLEWLAGEISRLESVPAEVEPEEVIADE